MAVAFVNFVDIFVKSKGKLAELTPKKWSVIVALAKEDLSYSAITQRVGCSKASVCKTLKLFN